MSKTAGTLLGIAVREKTRVPMQTLERADVTPGLGDGVGWDKA